MEGEKDPPPVHPMGTLLSLRVQAGRAAPRGFHQGAAGPWTTLISPWRVRSQR